MNRKPHLAATGRPRRHSRGPRGGDARAQRGRDGFFDRVYALVARIPTGRVTTYGEIARMLGAPRAARAVGWAMHGNPHGALVPCHRVVQRGGTCSPNFRLGDPGAQRRLLEREGVRFLPGGRIDFKTHEWRPRADAARSHRRR